VTASRATIAVGACTLGSAAAAALGLWTGAWWAGLLPAAAWTAAAVATARVPGLAALLPALALAGGGAPALAGWTAAGLGIGALLARTDEDRRRARGRADRRALRSLELERETLDRHLARYPLLLDASLDLATARDPDQVAQTICAAARQLLAGSLVSRVYLAAEHGPRLAAGDGDGPEPDAAAIAFVLAEARPLVRREPGLAQVLLPLRADRRAQQGIPERRGEAPRGVLAVAAPVGHLDDLDLDALAAAARLGGLGLAAVDLVAQARALALTDDLTGLLGAHEFHRRLDEQAAQARRRGEPLALLACDMDHLKRYNDAHGHAAGDRALLAVARAIIATVPPGALASRSGGEEFAVLLPGMDAAAAMAVAEAVCAAVRAEHPEPDHPGRRVTVSIGVAALAAGEPGRALLARADAACYQAKHAGRDRVVAA
jgi:diguanylate cyclase (GGDEF)-like protein